MIACAWIWIRIIVAYDRGLDPDPCQITVHTDPASLVLNIGTQLLLVQRWYNKRVFYIMYCRMIKVKPF